MKPGKRGNPSIKWRIEADHPYQVTISFPRKLLERLDYWRMKRELNRSAAVTKAVEEMMEE